MIRSIPEPNQNKIKDLLSKTHAKGIPYWTSVDLLDVYEELNKLYLHWFREEIEHDKNDRVHQRQ